MELARERPRFGFRRLHALLAKEGRRVNVKRVHRLCRREGLAVRRNPRKRRATGASSNGVAATKATRPNEGWTWDFTHGWTASGAPIKWLSVVDEFTRELLALRTARRCRAEDCMEVLAALVHLRGAPAFVRSDNGPEFVAKELRTRLEKLAIGTRYIEPGSPWQNGKVESFHGKFKDEFVKVEEFATLAEAKAKTAAWLEDYNERRPHSALGYETPSAYAAAWRNDAKRPKESVARILPPAAAQQPAGRVTGVRLS